VGIIGVIATSDLNDIKVMAVKMEGVLFFNILILMEIATSVKGKNIQGTLRAC
jgi:hypothetical protein